MWVKGIVESYFSTDSVHLWYDDPAQKEIVAILKAIADETESSEEEVNPPRLWKEYYLVNYLDHDIVEYQCRQCGKTYESFTGLDRFCSMQCFNDSMNGTKQSGSSDLNYSSPQQ